MLLRGDPRLTYAGENLREASVKTENFSFRDPDNQGKSRVRRNPQKYPKQNNRSYGKMDVSMESQARKITPIERKRGDRNPRTEC